MVAAIDLKNSNILQNSKSKARFSHMASFPRLIDNRREVFYRVYLPLLFHGAKFAQGREL